MNKEQKEAELIKEIQQLSKRSDQVWKELEFMKGQIEIELPTLIKQFEAKNDNFFSIDFSIGEYEFILGGDGRSAPWSEKRNGTIMTVKISSEFYLSDETFSRFREYIKATRSDEFDHLVIKVFNPHAEQKTI